MVILRNTKLALLQKVFFIYMVLINYINTYLPIVKIDSIKVILALAVQYDYSKSQLNVNVKNTFLNGILEKKIYLEFSKGIKKPKDSNLVLKLHKSLMGYANHPELGISNLMIIY